MLPITFGVGPSRISMETCKDICEAPVLGITEISHRSSQFSAISKKAIDGLRSFFSIPDEYSIFFTSSATEAMELTVRNVVRQKSCHFTCGKFSELFTEIAAANGKNAQQISAPWGSAPTYDASLMHPQTELITITANETSTGVMCSTEDILRIRASCPNSLLAVDITSIAGMRTFPISEADIWLFSVQKGFGLPSGLGIIIVSPRALQRASELEQSGDNRAGVFTFSALEKIMREKHQTVCTPNVLDIFLLGRQLKRWNAVGGCATKERETRAKAEMFYDAISIHPKFRCFVDQPSLRSISVACIRGSQEDIEQLHTRAAQEGLLPGKGYGKIKATTARIALFPAIAEEDLRNLVDVIRGIEC